jgi:ABC-type lipoprotein export system ATPase subunit
VTEPLVAAERISRSFGAEPTATDALREATCVIHSGDRIALTGPSGSGKSTLLHVLGGLDLPTTGVVSWPGLGPRDELRPGRVIDVFQGPSLMPPLSVLENVRFPLLLRGVGDDEATQQAHNALAYFDLDHLSDKLPEEISGGQAQRASIARAVAVEPMLVLADEPTGQLDSATAHDVLDRLLQALDMIGAALVVATHDPRVTERLETVWTIRKGVLWTGSEMADANLAGLSIAHAETR